MSAQHATRNRTSGPDVAPAEVELATARPRFAQRWISNLTNDCARIDFLQQRNSLSDLPLPNAAALRKDIPATAYISAGRRGR